MTVTYTFDVFSSLDGYGSNSGNWGGYWGEQEPRAARPPPRLVRPEAFDGPSGPTRMARSRKMLALEHRGVRGE